MKTLSCIIPVYGLSMGSNREYFKHLLKSITVASAKHLQHIEIVFVNDDPLQIEKAEIDNILLEVGYQGKIVYHQNKENKGQAYSRNIGIALATSKYLHIIDQDDYISENFYDCFFSASESELYISTPYFNINDSFIKKAYTPLLPFVYSIPRTVSSLWFLLASNVAYSPGQVIFSKTLIDKAGGFPILNYKGSDDYGLFYNIVFKTHASFEYLYKCKFYYRNHTQQNSKLCDMQASVAEFLLSVNYGTIRERIIHSLKLDRKCHLLNKIIYVLFFRRVVL